MGGGYEGAATMPAHSQVGSSLSARSAGLPPVVTVPPTAAGWDEGSRSADSAIPHSTLVSSRGVAFSPDGHRGMLRVVPDVPAAPASTRLAGTGPLAAVPTAVVHDYEDIHGAGARPVMSRVGSAESQSGTGAADKGAAYPWMAGGLTDVPAADTMSDVPGAPGAVGPDGVRSTRLAGIPAGRGASATNAPVPGTPTAGAPVMPLPGEDIPVEAAPGARGAADARRTTPRGPLAGVLARLPLLGRAAGRGTDGAEVRAGRADSASVRPERVASAASGTSDASQDTARPSTGFADASLTPAEGDEAGNSYLASEVAAASATARDGALSADQLGSGSPDGRPFDGMPSSDAEAGVVGGVPEGPDAAEGDALARGMRGRRAQNPAKEAARAARRERRAAKVQAARARRRERLPQTIVSLVASVAVVALSITMLYFPAQDLYLALRENERLTNELDANLARNEQMQTRVDNLQTQEGIEDEARERFGLVEPGENLVKVVGVDDSTRSSFATPAEIPRGSGQNTHTWGTDLLDRIFGVEVPVVSTSASDEPAQVTEDDGVAGDSAAADAGEAAGTNGSADAAGEPADSDAGTTEGQPAEGGEPAGGDAASGEPAGAGATNANADIVVEGATPQG